MEQKPIPNFLAKKTCPELFAEIIADHPAVKIALSTFKTYNTSNCLTKLTVSKITKDLILFDGKQSLPDKWCETEKAVGQIFTLGEKEGKADSEILNFTKKFKVAPSMNRLNLVRDLLCYDGTAYPSSRKITSILVIYAATFCDGKSEIVSTFYQPPANWSYQFLQEVDSFYRLACWDAREGMSGAHPTTHDVSIRAEYCRRLA